jgi:hypothetical protein
MIPYGSQTTASHISVEEVPGVEEAAAYLGAVGHVAVVAHSLMALTPTRALGCPSHTCIAYSRHHTATAVTLRRRFQPQSRPPSP